jgi:NAD(P)-dependent dehydrogenase (short-subunit alcohol dehydrogenase family)
VKVLRGRTAVVTGAGSGIGRGMAHAFASEGMRLVLADIEEAAVTRLAMNLRAQGVDAVAVRTDVSDLSSVRHLLEVSLDRFQSVHLLCNNAGVTHRRRGINATHEDWTWILGVNLWGVVHGIEVFLPWMLEQDAESHIVNTSSMNGIFPSGLTAMYSTSKYGVMGLTETIRNELRGTPVSISALCPAAVTSRILDADRNRPKALAPGSPPPPHTPITTFELSPPLDPRTVGDLVVDGVRSNALYIFTDLAVRRYIQEHHDEMMRAFDRLEEFQRRRSENS